MPDPRAAPILPSNVVDLRASEYAASGADLFPLTVRDLTYQVDGKVLVRGIDLTL